jgi:hypothetical protein
LIKGLYVNPTCIVNSFHEENHPRKKGRNSEPLSYISRMSFLLSLEKRSFICLSSHLSLYFMVKMWSYDSDTDLALDESLFLYVMVFVLYGLLSND